MKTVLMFVALTFCFGCQAKFSDPDELREAKERIAELEVTDTSKEPEWIMFPPKVNQSLSAPYSKTVEEDYPSQETMQDIAKRNVDLTLQMVELEKKSDIVEIVLPKKYDLDISVSNGEEIVCQHYLGHGEMVKLERDDLIAVLSLSALWAGITYKVEEAEMYCAIIEKVAGHVLTKGGSK